MYWTAFVNGWVDIRLLSMIGITTPVHQLILLRLRWELTADTRSSLSYTHSETSLVVEMFTNYRKRGKVDESESKTGPDSLSKDGLP